MARRQSKATIETSRLKARIRELEASLSQTQPTSKVPCDNSRKVEGDFAHFLQRTSRTVCFSWHNGHGEAVYSENAAQVLGYPASTVSDKSFIRDHIAESDRERIRQRFKQCIQLGEGYDTELQMIKRNGEPCWFLMRIRVMELDDNGLASHIIGTLTDIDALKREQLTQTAVAESEQELRETLRCLLEDDSWENIEQTLASLAQRFQIDRILLRWLDPDTKRMPLIDRWSSDKTPYTDPYADLTAGQLPKLMRQLEQRKPVILYPATPESIDPPLLQLLLADNIESMALVPIFYQERIDGLLVLPAIGQPKHWSNRELETAIIIADALGRAVSRNRITRQLEASEQRFQYAMQASRDGVWDWELNTNKLYLSPGYLHMLGYEEGELESSIDTLVNHLLYPGDLAFCSQVFEQARHNPQQPIQCEYRMRHKDGHLVWVFTRALFVSFDGQQRPLRAVGVNADISQFKEAQAQLQQAKWEADAANRIKSEFLARMSHEIRTPLNAIIGMSHLLHGTVLNPQQQEYLTSVHDSADSLLHIIDEILDFSKLEAGKYLLEDNHFDIERVLSQLSKRYAQAAESKGIELVFDIASDVPRFVKGDALRLLQILSNLLDNAVKFTERGEITLSARKLSQDSQGIELEFALADTGVGFETDLLQDLLNPFTQADGSSSRRFGGTGLGLSICRYLIEQMHGRLQAETRQHQGSCFRFNAHFKHSHLGEQPLQHNPTRFKGLRTLIVDDHPGALLVLKKTAEALQLAVQTATEPQQALQLLRAADQRGEPFQLLLIDFKMPGLNGVEVCNEIQQACEIQHKPKRLLVSNYSRDDIAESIALTNVQAFINKPVTASRIFDAIALAFGESLFEASTEPDTNRGKGLRGSHLLLAEDNLVNQKVAAGMLKKKGIQVTIAHNGQQALDLLLQHPPDTFDAILMDMEMPEMDGYEATRRIRAGDHCADIPIIAMTAHALQGDREKCLAAGMDDYITKPVNPDLLYQALEHFLSLTPSNRQL